MAEIDFEPKIRLNLRFSRSAASSTWGKRVIRAIDADDPLALVKVFQSREDTIEGADVNAIVDDYGYGGYTWSANIMPYVGDTALNIALKLRKEKCVWGLLMLNIDTTIKNEKGISAEDLAIDKFKKEISLMRAESLEMLMHNLDPRRFDELPDVFILRGVGTEGWNLMEYGRSTYVELPDCLMRNRDKVVIEGVNDTDGVVKGANIDITDMFCRNDITDVSKTIRNQNKRAIAQEKIDMEKDSGLGLLGSVSTKTPHLSERTRKTLALMPGISKLSFLGGKSIGDIIKDQEVTVDRASSARNIEVYSTQTNMRYMRVTNYGASKLAEAVIDNRIITQLVLSKANISNIGIKDLAPALATMHKLVYLDLSQNAIEDKGAFQIAEFIGNVDKKCTDLAKVSLAGNRFHDKPCEKLLIAAHEQGLRYLALFNNKTTGVHRDALKKLHQSFLKDIAKSKPKISSRNTMTKVDLKNAKRMNTAKLWKPDMILVLDKPEYIKSTTK